MSRARLPLLAVAALTLALGGCGGGGRLSKADYQQKLKSAGRELSQASAKLAQARTGPEFVTGVEEVQQAMRDVADDLDGVDPPKDVASANDRLVRALRALADRFDQVKEAAKGGAKKARDAGARLAQSKASEEARQAVLYIERLGYAVGLLGGT
jgi:cytochrome c556